MSEQDKKFDNDYASDTFLEPNPKFLETKLQEHITHPELRNKSSKYD